MINPFSNPSYLVPPLAASAACCVMAAMVWRTAHGRLGALRFCIFLLFVGLWSFFIFCMRSSPSVDSALPWEKAMVASYYATFVLYYHFTLNYTNNKSQRGFLVAAYLLAGLVVALAPTELVIQKMRVEDYGYAPVIGPIVPLLSISSFILMGGGVYNLSKRYRLSHSYDEKNRIVYLLFALPLPLLGGLLDAFSDLPPIGIWANLIFCLMCTFAILKYNLLDIHIVVRKSLSYLLISVTVAIPYVGTILVMSQVIKAQIESWWVHALVLLIWAVLLLPLYTWAQQFVDRLFYRDRYDHLRALQRFSHQAHGIMNLQEIGSEMVRLVSGAMQTLSVCLLLPSEGKDGLVVTTSTGLESPPPGVVLRTASPFVKWLEVQGDILPSEQLAIIPQLQSIALRERKNLEKLGAELYVPIKTRQGQLSGILVLGQKLFQQSYSNEDRQLLMTLSNHMGMVLENARLFDDALRARGNLETWVNSMSDCVMIVGKDYAIQFMNKAAIKKFGSAIGKRCWEALGKDTVCRKCPIQQRLRSKRGALQYSDSIRDRDYDIAAAPQLNPDGSLSVIEVLRDVTERKQAEEREKHLQQELHLASRLASIGELAAGVAHEINNPLTGIVGYSQRLLRRNTDERLERDLQRIYDEAWRAAKVVENLLTFASRRESKKEYADINGILHKALELRTYELKTSNIEVVTDFAVSLPETMVDFGQIQQVFLNIIVNAEQAMTEAQGRGRFSIKIDQVGSFVRVSFADNGPGIRDEDVPKLFDPYFTTRGDRGGTGLGLSVCHGIVTDHGGRIYVENELGKGATFVVELPIISETGDYNKVGKEQATPIRDTQSSRKIGFPG